MTQPTLFDDQPIQPSPATLPRRIRTMHTYYGAGPTGAARWRVTPFGWPPSASAGITWCSGHQFGWRSRISWHI